MHGEATAKPDKLTNLNGDKAALKSVKIRMGQIEKDPKTSKAHYRAMAAKLNRRA